MPDIEDDPPEDDEEEILVELPEEIANAIGKDDGDRMLLTTLLPFLDAYASDKELSCRVQLAVDQAVIAVAERIVRISGSDLPKVEEL